MKRLPLPEVRVREAGIVGTAERRASGIEEIVVSSVLLGWIAGAFGGGILADRLGRRILLISTAIVFGLGPLERLWHPTRHG
jgi:MFS family permease